MPIKETTTVKYYVVAMGTATRDESYAKIGDPIKLHYDNGYDPRGDAGPLWRAGPEKDDGHPIDTIEEALWFAGRYQPNFVGGSGYNWKDLRGDSIRIIRRMVHTITHTTVVDDLIPLRTQ